MTPDPEDILMWAVVLMVLAGFSGMVAMGVAKQVARQRIAENLFRERLARAWGVVRGPEETKAR